MESKVTTTKRELQAQLDAGKIETMRAFRRALWNWKEGRMVLVKVGPTKQGAGGFYASAQAPCGRRVRFKLPFDAKAQGGKLSVFEPFVGEPAPRSDGSAPDAGKPWFVYGLFAGRGEIEAAFVGATDTLMQTLWRAGQPADARDERKRFEGWAAEDGWPVRVAVLDYVDGEAGAGAAREAATILRLRWARAAALAGYDLPGRADWCAEVGRAEPITPWPTEALEGALRELADVNHKGRRPALRDFTLPAASKPMGLVPTPVEDGTAPRRRRPVRKAASAAPSQVVPPMTAAPPAPVSPSEQSAVAAAEAALPAAATPSSAAGSDSERTEAARKVVQSVRQPPEPPVRTTQRAAKPTTKAPVRKKAAPPRKASPRSSLWSMIGGSPRR